MNLANELTGFLSGIPLNAVLRERAALWKERVDKLENDVLNLKEENDKLKKEAVRLRQELEAYRAKEIAPNQFVEARGALFRRNKKGDFDRDAYCIVCKTPMVSVGSILPFYCSKCRARVGFSGSDLFQIIDELREDE